MFTRFRLMSKFAAGVIALMIVGAASAKVAYNTTLNFYIDYKNRGDVDIKLFYCDSKMSLRTVEGSDTFTIKLPQVTKPYTTSVSYTNPYFRTDSDPPIYASLQYKDNVGNIYTMNSNTCFLSGEHKLQFNPNKEGATIGDAIQINNTSVPTQ